MRRVAFAIVGILVVVFSTYVFGQSATPKTIALRCGSLFDGRGDALRKNVLVVIEGDRVKDVTSAAPGGADGTDIGSERRPVRD